MMARRIKLKRVRLYTPEWEGPVEGYTKNFLRANFWRVERLMEYGDALSECYCVFLHLQREYFGVVDNPWWFMSLYKTSLWRKFNTLSNRDTAHRNRIVYLEEQEMAEQAEVGALAEFISDLENAPEEALALLRVLLDAPLRFVQAVYQCEESEDQLELLVGAGSMSFKTLKETLLRLKDETHSN